MPNAEDPFVLEKQLTATFGRLPAVLLMFPAVGAAVWVPLRHHVQPVVMMTWLLVVVLNAVVQWTIGRRYQRLTHRDLQLWSKIRIVCALVNGVIWGGVLGTVLLFPANPVLANFTIFVIGGTSITALASTGAHRSSLYAFLVANNLPAVIHLLLEDGKQHLAMAALLLGFLATVLIIAQRITSASVHLIRAESANHQLLSELTRAQAELREANATLQRSVEERTTQLKVALAEKEAQQQQLRQAERMEAIGRLAGGIAHDFNNVLTGIAGFASMVVESLDAGDERREDLDEILAATERAGRLTKQLLGFAKGGITRPQVLELTAHLRDLDKMLRRVLPDNIELSWHFGDGTLHLYLDPGQLDQLIMNLVVNARDAMPDGGTISLHTLAGQLDQQGTPCAVIRVADTGKGVSSDVIEHIFEPFVSTKGAHGTGLGLATCFGIVKRAGGSIQVSSDSGHGATFEVRLPLSAKVVAVPSEPPRSSNTRSGKGYRVLVVEDQPAILKMVGRALETRGFVVYQAVSAEQALALVLTRGINPDLVISDVVLPHMSGIELFDALRQHGCTARYLMMSGYIDETSLRRKDRGETAALLTKPFTTKQLYEAVYEVLGPEDEPLEPLRPRTLPN